MGKRVSDTEKEIYNLSVSAVHDLEKATGNLRKLDKAAFQHAMKEASNRHIMNVYVTYKLNLLITKPILEAHKLAQLGVPVYLYTDFETSLIMPEYRLIDWIAQRHPDGPAIIYPLNEIINHLRENSNLKPFKLDTGSKPFLELWSELRQRENLSDQEQKVIRIIRAKEYQRITVNVQGGNIIRADIEEELPKQKLQSLEKEIIEIINAKEYQKIMIDVRDGKPVRLNNKSSIKFT